MNKFFRKVLSAVTAAVMTVTAFSFSAYADSVTDELAPALLEGAMKREKNIDISSVVNKNKWSISEVTDLLANAYLICPELFFASNMITVNSLGSKYYVLLDYEMTEEQYRTAKAKLDAAAEKIVAGITPSMTDVEKLLYVHDYIVLNCKYDYTKSKYDMYDCLVDKSAVCQGYSLAYMYILKTYLNIDCSIVYSDSMGHAWNYVKLGNKWYHVDVTKDDASTVYMNASYDNLGFVMHENFLMSDDLAKKTSQPHYDWEIIGNYPRATDKTYDSAFWRNTNSPVVLNGKIGYYAVRNDDMGVIDICSYNFSTDTSRTLLRVKGKWYARRSEDGRESYEYGRYSYRQIWMSLAIRNGKLYFNTNKNVYSFDLSTRKTKKLYTLNKDNDQQIFGLMFTSANNLRVAYRADLTYPESTLTLRLK